MARSRPTQLSEKERSVLAAVEELCEQSPYLPSIREVCQQAKIDSPSQVSFYLKSLQEKGYIERERERLSAPRPQAARMARVG